jgi:hypothetical protein
VNDCRKNNTFTHVFSDPDPNRVVYLVPSLEASISKLWSDDDGPLVEKQNIG